VANVTVTVNGSGGNYTSLAAAIAGTAANLVTTTDQLSIVCYASATADRNIGTTQITVSGYTTNATYYVHIYTPTGTGDRHPGWWQNPGSETFYYIGSLDNTGTSIYSLIVPQDYTLVEGVAFFSAYRAINPTGTSVTINSCLMTQVNSNYLVLAASGSPTLNNCVLIGGGSGATVYGGGTTICNNCTAVTTSAAFESLKAVNCITLGGGTSNYNNMTAGSDYNASDSSTTSGGTHDRASQTFTFVNSSAGNYQLTATDAGARGFGSNLSSTFTTDIAGNTRTVPWDIGAWKAFTPIPASVTLTGALISLTAEPTTESGKGTKTITGSLVTSAPGSVAGGVSNSKTLIGVSTTTSAGVVTETGQANYTLSGASEAIGAGAAIESAITLSVTGASVTATVGSVYFQSNSAPGGLQTLNLNNSRPSAPPGYVNIMWQADPPEAPNVVRNVSAYVEIAGVTSIVAASSNYTAADGNLVLCTTTAGSFQVNLPTSIMDYTVSVKKVSVDSNTVTIVPSSGQIDGSSTLIVSAFGSCAYLVCDGQNWWIV